MSRIFFSQLKNNWARGGINSKSIYCYSCSPSYIGGFPIDASELDLARLLEPFGDISAIKIVREPNTGHCKGYAFIEMASQSLHGIKFYKRIHDTTLAERVLTVGMVDTETAVIRQQEKLRRFVVVSKPQQGYITELKKKRPRKTQLPQLLNTGEKKENFE